MKRTTITDFNGGLNNKADPLILPDNVLTAITNYEYRDLTGLRKRFGTADHELSNAMLTNIRKFGVWYPNRKPADMSANDDKIYVIHTSDTYQTRGEDIIEISTPAELYAVRDNLSGNYILVDDIDISEYTNWEAIGTSAEPFSGIINGNGKTISNLTIISANSNPVGLFSTSEGANFINLKLTGEINHEEVVATGLLVGKAISTTFTNICVEATITCADAQWVGGVAGFFSSGSATKCYSTGTLTDTIGGMFYGGLFGEMLSTIGNTDCIIEDSCSNMTITAWSFAGGIAGGVADDVYNNYIDRCYFGGALTYGEGNGCGGLVGYGDGDDAVTITSSYWDTQISGVETSYWGGTGLETHRMIREEFFTDWDFEDVWSITEQTSYPYLSGQTPVEPTYNSVTVSSDNTDTFIVPSTISIEDLTITNKVDGDIISNQNGISTTYYDDPIFAWFGDLEELTNSDKYLYNATPVRDVVISWTENG